MKLSDYRQEYYGYSSKLSEITRQLNFAGIAIIWIFRVGDKNGGGIPFAPSLLWVLYLFAVSLAFDLGHYIYATAAWGLFCRRKEKAGVKEDKVLKAPIKINWPTLGFFWGKVCLNVVGYLALIVYIAGKLG